MRFGVLGPLEVWTSNGRPVRIRETKIRALLSTLLAHRGRVLSVDRLVDALWGDAPPANDVRTLRSKVSLLRRTLEEAESGGRDLVESRPPGYLLRVADNAVDAERFEALLRRALTVTGDPRAKVRLLGEAVGLWRGPSAFSDHADDEYVRAEARRLEEQRLVALEELAAARLELGEHALVASELDELVATHPLRERLRAVHVRALYLAGRQGEALAEVEEVRRRLRDDLGLDPGRELADLHEAILRQDTGLDPAATSVAKSCGNLPAPLADLIGRAEEVRRIGALLASDRLVTLTGIGGIGKTRLALEVAARRAADFPDGVWLIEFAATGNATEVHEAVAAVLGVQGHRHGEGSLQHRLAGALAGRNALLVLDNCEHVSEQVAELTARLLRAAPTLRVLATSREPLAVVGERLWPVAPLELPGPDTGRPEDASAVRLFLARATAADPGFRLEKGNAEAITTICRRLDGIPLALEMAAARVRGMSVTDLADRLDDRFHVLTATLRGVPERQKTLRATIDWSWRLLSEPEQAVLRRLAVCADGCALEAAETVCADGQVRRGDVLALLGRLVDRSLVVLRDGRYRLLESVAAYCAERLSEAGDDRHTRNRHLAYYVDVAERADAGLRGPEQRLWLQHLETETANFRAALAHAVRHGLADSALRLVNALTWFWFLRGRFVEARRSLDFALSAGGDSGQKATALAWRAGMAHLLLDTTGIGEQAASKLCAAIENPGIRARARWFLALSRVGFGDAATTLRLADRAHDDFDVLGDRWGVAATLAVRAEVFLYQGRRNPARADAERAMASFRELGDGWGQLQAAYVLGDLAEMAGDYVIAEDVRQEGHRLAHDLGLWNDMSKMLARLGRTAMLTGDLDRAELLHERARRLAVAHAYQRGEEFAQVGLGLVARRQGRLNDAESHFRTWLDWCRRWEGDHGVALILAELGFIAEQRGEVHTARRLHREGLDHACRTGDPRALALAWEGLAGAEALAGDHVEAARLLGAAEAARREVDAPLPVGERHDVDRITARVRAGLSSEAYDRAFARGAENRTGTRHLAGEQ